MPQTKTYSSGAIYVAKDIIKCEPEININNYEHIVDDKYANALSCFPLNTSDIKAIIKRELEVKPKTHLSYDS